MQRAAWGGVLLAVLATMTSGCGRADGPVLAAAGGTVSYKGAPLEGASVVFAPDKGPTAYGTTDAEGKFVWTTQGEPGAMVGSGKVAITAFEPYEMKNEEDLTAEDLNKMNKSRIPERYGRMEASGLTATVTAEGANAFSFDLTE